MTWGQVAIVLLLSFRTTAFVAGAAPPQNEIIFSPEGNTFTNFVVVHLSSSNALIRYTRDGSEPTERSPNYSLPLLLDETTVLNARTFPSGQPPGPTFTQNYVVHREAITNFASNLPLVVIDTLGQAIDLSQRTTHRSVPRPKLSAAITVLGMRDGRSSLLQPAEHQGRAEVSIHGGSTAVMWKKPLKLELQDASGADLKVGLLGMPKESDWVLLASFRDRTFIRDVLTYELWRQMGHYAPRWRFVEVFIKTNGSASLVRPHPQERELTFNSRPPEWGDYAGIYILVEKIKRGKERLDISRLRSWDDTEPRVTGGYIFKLDRVNASETGFRSERRIPFAFDEPKERDITPAQRNYLTNYVNELERVLFGKQFRDPTNGYAKYIDVDSFVDYHWMMEMAKDMDGYTLSQFLHKDRLGKLKRGPVWDMDMAYGNTVYLKGYRTNDWRWAQVKGTYAWYDRLFEDEDFLQRYIDRWSELRTNIFATSNVLSMMDRLAEQVREAQSRNAQRWPVFGEHADAKADAGRAYEAEVNRLKRWISGRLAWIDSQGFPPPVAQVLREASAPGPRLSMTCQIGKIYYTTDDTDPRLRGGSISPAAKQYASPIPLGTNLVITARVRSDFGLWSAPIKVSAGDVGK